MKPNLAKIVKHFGQTIKLIKTTQTIVNFKPQEIEEEVTINATVQPADKEKLTTDNIDYSLQYIQINTTAEVKINDIVEYKNKRFKIISLLDYSDYGYYEAVAEEIKK